MCLQTGIGKLESLSRLDSIIEFRSLPNVQVAPSLTMFDGINPHLQVYNASSFE